MDRKIKYILDADIQGCFDNFDHKILRQLLENRIKDKSLLRLINKWLKAGVVDGDSLEFSKKGSPQGNIISPLLCNVYLHYVLDAWIMEQVKPLMKGKIFIVRYADDFVIGFENKEDAQKVYKTLPKRMHKYGLTIHPEKSKLVEFNPRMKGKTPTIDFLGFTHYWAKSVKGTFVVKRRTTKKGLRKGFAKIEECCKENRHKRLKEQYQKLRSILYGQYQYYGIRSNFNALKRFYHAVQQRWYYWLNKRSQTNSYTWKGYKELLKYFVLPRPRIVNKNV